MTAAKTTARPFCVYIEIWSTEKYGNIHNKYIFLHAIYIFIYHPFKSMQYCNLYACNF